MKNLIMFTSRNLVTIFFLLNTDVIHAGRPPPPLAAVCDAALTITSTAVMDFGSYIGGTTGTIVMSAVDGTMTYTGVTPVVAAPGVAATFELTTTNKDCQNGNLTLPASITIDNSGAPITINNLSIDPNTYNFRVKSNKAYILNIGGTLQAVAGDAPGTYTGPFDITFTYPPP